MHPYESIPADLSIPVYKKIAIGQILAETT